MNNEFPKLSKKEIRILELLISKGEVFGLEIVKASEDELKRGTIYIILQRMGDKGYVESREEPSQNPAIGISRRKFWATGLGERVYRTNLKAQEFFNSELVFTYYSKNLHTF